MGDHREADNICEYEEDVLIPAQDERLKAAVEAMVRSCEHEDNVNHVGGRVDSFQE